MPGMSGPELQRELLRRHHTVPVVFITAHVDEMICRRLLEQGAIECLAKPFSDTKLLDVLQLVMREG
jgi:FixJ family two-component response regulator